MEVIGYPSNPLDSICYVCLSQSRRTFPLGLLGEYFNKIITFYKTNFENVKLCWECMAVLRKFKTFETKCYVAQQALSRIWSGIPPECLSNLVETRPEVHYFVHDENTLYDDVKAEKSSIHDQNEPFDTFLDETTELPIDYDSIQIAKSEFETDNDVKVFDDEIKDTAKLVITVTPLNTDVKDNTSQVEVKEEGKRVKKEKNGKVKFKDRRSLKEGALDGHYTLVKNESGANYVKVDIDPSELEDIINSDRTADFFVNAAFKCHHCVVKFPCLRDLERHNSNVHDEALGKHTCHICKYRFPSKTALNGHLLKHNYVHKCSVCELRCYSKQRLRIHVKLHKKAIKCDLCGQQFVNLVVFAKHFKANHSVYICDHCGKKCRTKYTLEKHMRRHMEPNICQICKKTYKSRSTLKHHMDVKHTTVAGELAYCVQCDKQFANVALYKRHIFSSAAHKPERTGGRDNRQVKCPLCEKVYSRRCYMMNHYRHVHMKQSNHYCAECDRYFLNRTRYIEHRMYNHEGKMKEKNKICNFCGKAFAEKRTLLNHIRTHSGERPYGCDYCDASFTQKHCMTSHVKYIHLKSLRRGIT